MADFTLLEVRPRDGFGLSPTNSVSFLSKGVDAFTDTNGRSYDGYDVGPNAKFDADESDEFDEVDDAGLDGRLGLGLLVGLVLLVGITAVVRYVRGDNDDLDELVGLGDADDEECGEVEVDA